MLDGAFRAALLIKADDRMLKVVPKSCFCDKILTKV